MIPKFKIFSSFFVFKSAFKAIKIAKIAIFSFVCLLVGCSFQQSAPRKLVTTTTEAATIESSNEVEFINLSATNGEKKPVILLLLEVNYPKAEKLSLRGHKLESEDFPFIKHVGSTLTYLDLSECNLNAIPLEVAGVGALKTIYLSDNNIKELNAEFYSLDKLTYINLDRNSLTNLPEGIAGLKSLKWLRLNNNKLSSLPADIVELKNIKRLYLNKNDFTEIPEEIKQMTSLEELSLGGNKITEFPEWLCEMPNLKRIDLYGNPIKNVPDKIFEMPSLSTLVMDNCLLDNDRKLEINKKLTDKRIKFIF